MEHKNNKLRIRWLIRKDLKQVLEIEREQFPHAWTEEDFLACLRQRNCIGMVATEADEHHDSPILGFMVYELRKSHLTILNFAVHPDFEGEGVGSAMIQRLIDKLSIQRRKKILVDVVEWNVDAQFFLREMGFRVRAIIKSPYDECDDDAYRFVYELDKPYKHSAVFENRISDYVEEHGC